MKKKSKSTNLSETISSNVLFHFTDSPKKLENILTEGFRAPYVLEQLPRKSLFYIAPMVCFCDIPLGGIKVHLNRYGNYGLGIHKTFCRKGTINPVFYLHNPTIFNQLFHESGMEQKKTTPYLKRYYGKNLKTNEEIRFYNEREWRHVAEGEVQLFSEEKDAKEKRDAKNEKGNYYLKFALDKIEYIIVENNSEIRSMLNFISERLGKNSREKKMLYTKLLSSVRIKNDF